jgi:eukaryotic-like serine/threonine-protein kinase
MALAAGARLGPYEVLSVLGAGGMGEVWRARDTKLGRDVALKLLPDSFTHDPERLARFRREAQVLASLNHPHIGAIYGLDEANGQQFLVLELIDGETLAARLTRGVIVSDVLPRGRSASVSQSSRMSSGLDWAQRWENQQNFISR